MDTKHRTVQLLGIVALVCGGLLIGFGLRRLFPVLSNVVLGHTPNIIAGMTQATVLAEEAHFFAGIAFVIGLGLYIMSVGLRGLRWAKGTVEKKVPKVKWGRVLFGSWLILNALGVLANHFHPVPTRFEFKPSNERQAAAMAATEIVLSFLMPPLGVWLIISGIRAKFEERVNADKSSKIVP